MDRRCFSSVRNPLCLRYDGRSLEIGHRPSGLMAPFNGLRRFGALLALLALMGVITPANGGIHRLGEVAAKGRATSVSIELTVGRSGRIPDTVIFELSHAKDLVLEITPIQHEPSMTDHGQLTASLWTQDGELIGTLAGRPRRLLRHLGAGTYQLRVDGWAEMPTGHRYMVTIGPRTGPQPKLWAMLALGLAILGLQVFHGFRATSRQTAGRFSFRMPS